MGAPHGTGHARPGLLEGENAFNIVATDLLTRNRVNDRGFNTEEGQGGASRLGRGNTTHGGDDMGTRLRLPVCLEAVSRDPGNKQPTKTYVANVGLLLSDFLKVPFPNLGGNGFPNGAQDTQVLHLVLDEMVASALQQPKSSRGDVELRHPVLFDHIPVAGEVGVRRSALEDDRGAAQKQGRIHNVGVAGDPADVATTEEAVIIVDIKHILARQGSTEKVSGGSVHNTLRLASRARGVEQEQWVLGVN